MAGLKNLKTPTFKSVELDRNVSKATNQDEFINNAEGETSWQRPERKLSPGAPKKLPENKRTQKVLICFTEREVFKIKEMAEEKSMKISEFIRFKIFNSL